MFFLEGQASKSGRNNILQKGGLNYLPKVLRENKFIYFKYIKYQNVIFKLKKNTINISFSILCGLLVLLSSAKELLKPTCIFHLCFPKSAKLFRSNILCYIYT